MTTDTKAPNSVRHLPSFAQTLRDEAAPDVGPRLDGGVRPGLSDRLASIWGELDPVDEWRPIIRDAASELSRLSAETYDLRHQLWDEKRQHEITRGDLARTRLACDELLAADDGRNVVIGGRPAPADVPVGPL